MKRIFERLIRFVLLLGTNIVFISCGNPSTIEDGTFTISGLITDYLSAEPIHGVKVSLYIDPCLYNNPSEYENSGIPTLSSTVVTYDDGFYSFTRKHGGSRGDEYFISVDKEGYEKSYSQRIEMFDKKEVTVDLQMKRIDPEMVMTTYPPTMRYVSQSSYEKSLAFEGQCKYSDRDHAPFTYGFVYGPNRNPTIKDDLFISGTKTNSDGMYGTRFGFCAMVNGTVKGQTYYVRAYAKNNKGEAYGENVSFVAE